jgi:CRP/FNR family transcriptional regulator
MKRIPLEETELYRLLAPARIARIRPHLKRQAFEEGDYIYFDSQPAEFLWTVRSGEVRTLKGNACGRLTTLETLRPGDLFGLAAMTGTPQYAECAQGVLAGEVWRLPGSVAGSMLSEDAELGRAVLGMVANRLQNAHDRLCSFAHDRVPERLARALLDSADGARVEMTRRLLGEAAGTTVETAIRVLRRFERAGWIKGGVGWVHILDEEALGRLAAGEETDERNVS